MLRDLLSVMLVLTALTTLFAAMAGEFVAHSKTECGNVHIWQTMHHQWCK